ncbi:zinc-binding dehydrogenase [Streptomyces globosus]|uniref:zinc-binding dehydrogenase n=1 Tax=Streptomyces globosus TaxID=68209 RepID=UPI0031DE1145
MCAPIPSNPQPDHRVVALRPSLAAGAGVSAEYAALDERLAAGARAGVPLEHAAALPPAALTAEQALDRPGPGFAGRLLVCGAAGAVGGYLVRPAALRGLHPAALARPGDTEAVRGLGAAEVFTGAAPPPAGAYDIVIDAAGRSRTVQAVRDGGRCVSLTPFAVPDPERSVDVKVYGVRTDPAMLDTPARRVEDGHLALRIARVLPFEEAPRAHALPEAGGTRGKIVLTPGS